MLSNVKIKLINSLNAVKYREKHGLFVAEGTVNVLDFIQSGMQCEMLYATNDWTQQYGNRLPGITPNTVEAKDLKKISFLKNPAPVIGIFRLPVPKDIDLNQATDLTLMLDGIRDPGNLGTIIRTADWFGIDQIICSEDTVDAFNPKVVQASMGSLARVKVQYSSLQSLLREKPDWLKVFASTLDGESLPDIPKPQKGIIVIGSEAHGISSQVLDLSDQKITIQTSASKSKNSVAESLNASVATAIICYEFRR